MIIAAVLLLIGVYHWLACYTDFEVMHIFRFALSVYLIFIAIGLIGFGIRLPLPVKPYEISSNSEQQQKDDSISKKITSYLSVTILLLGIILILNLVIRVHEVSPTISLICHIIYCFLFTLWNVISMYKKNIPKKSMIPVIFFFLLFGTYFYIMLPYPFKWMGSLMIALFLLVGFEQLPVSKIFNLKIVPDSLGIKRYILCLVKESYCIYKKILASSAYIDASVFVITALFIHQNLSWLIPESLQLIWYSEVLGIIPNEVMSKYGSNVYYAVILALYCIMLVNEVNDIISNEVSLWVIRLLNRAISSIAMTFIFIASMLLVLKSDELFGDFIILVVSVTIGYLIIPAIVSFLVAIQLIGSKALTTWYGSNK